MFPRVLEPHQTLSIARFDMFNENVCLLKIQ